MKNPKQGLTLKNLGNGLFVVAFLAILLVPSAKALVMRGLMEAGLFKPAIPTERTSTPADLSNVRFIDAGGNVTDFSSLKGKVVFINFWATWCPPCLAEMPAINRFYQQFKDDKAIVFLMVDADGDLKKAQHFLDRKKYTFPLYQMTGTIAEDLYNGTLPTTLVFDRKGRLAYRGIGAANYASPKFTAFIQTLKSLK